MKILILILSIWSLPLFAQNQVAVIDDPDGFTNIRSGKGTNHPIIGKIEQGERFRFREDDSNWWLIETKDSIRGFVSSSRIRPLQKIPCACYAGNLIGTASDMAPSLVAHLAHDNKVSVCGYSGKRLSDSAIEISEFEVFDCATGSSLVEYGAMQYCRVEVDKDRLKITELSNLPVGEDWQFKLVPLAEQIIDSQNLQIIVNRSKPVLKVPPIPEKKIEDFLQSLRAQKETGWLKDWESDIFKLFITALTGNKEAETILLDFENYFDFKTDGAVAETYKEALATYQWINKK